jgi:hypothetical protein
MWGMFIVKYENIPERQIKTGLQGHFQQTYDLQFEKFKKSANQFLFLSTQLGVLFIIYLMDELVSSSTNWVVERAGLG